MPKKGQLAHCLSGQGDALVQAEHGSSLSHLVLRLKGRGVSFLGLGAIEPTHLWHGKQLFFCRRRFFLAGWSSSP